MKLQQLTTLAFYTVYPSKVHSKNRREALLLNGFQYKYARVATISVIAIVQHGFKTSFANKIRMNLETTFKWHRVYSIRSTHF
jgi:hypothetical protein